MTIGAFAEAVEQISMKDTVEVEFTSNRKTLTKSQVPGPREFEMLQDSPSAQGFADPLWKPNRNMSMGMVCVKDGLDNIGFRKFPAFVRSIHPDGARIFSSRK